ncbi:MAG: hypothetical protein ACXWNG_04015 [Candidatus Limnocylindrales bacterium]
MTFSAQPAVATLVGHWTVTPTARAANSAATSSAVSTVSITDFPELSPKENPAAHTAAAAARTAPAATSAPATGKLDFGTPPLRRSFIGMQGSKIICSYFPFGCNPPDMAVAASPSWVFQGVNTSFEVLNTAGHVQAGFPVSAQAFMGIPLNTCDTAAGGQAFLSDPRALYDPNDHRFWAAVLQVEGALGVATTCPFKTAYYIAVSQTSDPRGSWNVYEFDMSAGTTNAADYTQIGLSDKALTFSANMFNQAGTAYEYAEIFEANKARMEAGLGGFTADGFLNLQAAGPAGGFLVDTAQPAMNLTRGRSDPMFADTVDGPDLFTGNFCGNPTTDACSGLLLWTIHNPTAHDRGGPAPTLSGDFVQTKTFAFPPAADQPTCNQCVDGNDLRIGATVMIRGDSLYAAWGTAVDNGTQIVPGIIWAQVHLDRHPWAQTGYYNFSGDTAATYPAVMPGNDGSLTMVFDRMGHTINPEARYIVRGPFGFFGPGRLLKAGEAPYRPTLCGTATIPVCRWGDYEAASTDGNGHIWVASQYANSNTDPTVAPFFGRNWGTWIGELGN